MAAVSPVSQPETPAAQASGKGIKAPKEVGGGVGTGKTPESVSFFAFYTLLSYQRYSLSSKTF